MKITKLILYKYKRFALNNINMITYTPTAKIQIISGTNGSGKSSLLYELSPLPANIKQNYLEDGYKEIHIEHNGNEYILISGKDGSTKHNFVLNGEDINTGRTKRVQLTLCEQHFRITPELHEILISVRTFTNMSINDRKRWLSNLSTIDYTYPIGVYNKLKTRHRDVIGGIKILNTKISNLESKQVPKKELEDFIVEYDFIQSLIYDLIEKKENINYVPDNNLITELNTQNEILNKNLTKINSITVPNGGDSIEEITLKISLIENDIKTDVNKLNTITSIKDDSSIDDIEKELRNLQERLNEYTGKIYIDIANDEIDNIYYYLNNSYMSIKEYFTQLNEYRDLDITPGTINKYTNALNIITQKTKLKQDTLNNYMRELNILEINKNKKENECKKCGNTWKDGFDKKKYDHLKKITEELSNAIDKLGDEKDKIDTYLKEVDAFINIKNNFIKIIETNVPFSNIFYNNILMSKFDIYKNIPEIEHKLYAIKEQVNLNRMSFNLKNQINKLNDKKDIHIRNNEKMKDMDIESESSITERLNKLYENKQNLISIKDKLSAIQNIKNKIIEQNILIVKKLKSLKKNQKMLILNENNKYYNNVIGYFKELLLDLDKLIQESKYSTNNLLSLQTDIAELLEIKKALEFGLTTLSPTEGLIARSIMSFLGTFTVNINNIINSIWSYKMELLPPELCDGSDLDYKFKLNIEDNAIVEDISKASSGMSEVINLAHKIVAMHLLKLDDYPMYLDEYSRTFDPVHREKAYLVAKEFSNDYSQIFMVTHSQEIYGLYPNSELVILSNDNVFMNEIKKINTSINIQ